MTVDEELRYALEDAAIGFPRGPGLARHLESVARGVLVRHGLHRHRVRVRASGGTLEVRIDAPPGAPVVRGVQVRVS